MSLNTSNIAPIQSAAFNFKDFITGGVDPRTGFYSCALTFGDIQSAGLNGPVVPIRLLFDPLSQTDQGFGRGWSLPLTCYDERSRNLVLSSGERYQATETPQGLNFKELKLNTLRVLKTAADQFHVIHKNGLREELQFFGSSGIAVPIRQVSPNGAAVSLTYQSQDGMPVLTGIKDAERQLLVVDRQSSVIVTLYPGTECEAVFRLIQSSGETIIRLPSGDEWALEFERIGTMNCVTSVRSPQGGLETIVYKVDGHRLPERAPVATLPCVSAHTLFPRLGQPAITRYYDFSERNFLGGGSGLEWSNDGDNLYRAAADFQYTSTERLVAGTNVHSRTVRTFNRFHLLLSQVTDCAGKISAQKTVYHLEQGADLEHQPAQFRLPRIQTQRYESHGKWREESLRTEYDDYGNLIMQVEPSGVTTVCEFYAASGEQGCPADPLGFKRFEKQRTVTGAAGLPGAASTVTRYQYQLQRGLEGAATADVVLSRAVMHEMTSSESILRSTTDSTYYDMPLDRLRHGRLKTRTVLNTNLSTCSEFIYTQEGTALSQRTIVSGFDGTTKTSRLDLSIINGAKLREENEDEGTLVFKHDALGRVLSEVVAPGARFMAERETQYLSADMAKAQPAAVITTDVNDRKQKTVYDGMGRVIAIEELGGDGAFCQVYAAQHDALGRKVREVRTDHWPGQKRELTTTFLFDEWGEVKTTRHPDGRVEHRSYDPISLTEEKWIEGMGKVVTVNNDFGKPDTVEAFDLAGRSLGKTSYWYDGLGRGLLQTDQMGNSTSFEYDVYDRLIQTTLPDGQRVQTEYAVHSTSALPVQVKVGSRSVGEQAFDGLGRLTRSVAGKHVQTNGYLAGLSQPAWTQMPDTTRVEFSYEPALGSSITQRKFVGTQQELRASYAYDARLGLPVDCTEANHNRRCEYDDSGRLMSEILTQDGQVRRSQYTYSLSGRPLTCVDVLGNKHTTEYDTVGRPLSYEHDTVKATFAYNSLSQLVRVNAQDKSTGRTLITLLEYDDLGRETSRHFQLEDRPTRVLTSSYTLAGKLARKRLAEASSVMRDEGFTYDSRGRLEHYVCSGSECPRDPYGKEIRSQRYTFDALDNILTLTTEFPGGSNVASYTYDGDDPTRLIEIRHSHKDYPAPASLLYDVNGRLIKDEQSRSLTYDGFGRLTRVASAVGELIRGYHYDATDQLIALSQAKGAPVQRFYRDGRVINEVRGEESRTCLRQDEQLIGEQRVGAAAVTHLFSADQQQSILRSLKAGEQQNIAYTPYGSRPVTEDAFALQGFAGEQLDPMTGLYLLGNGYRPYSPTLMRFLVPDSLSPFGAGGLNPYAYCAGDPINRVDPTGHFWKALLGVVLAVVGVVVSVLTAGAATPLAVLGVGLAVTSGVVGLADTIIQTVAPHLDPNGVLGWVSFGFGIASMGAGWVNSATKGTGLFLSKVSNGLTKGISAAGGYNLLSAGYALVGSLGGFDAQDSSGVSSAIGRSHASPSTAPSVALNVNWSLSARINGDASEGRTGVTGSSVVERSDNLKVRMTMKDRLAVRAAF